MWWDRYLILNDVSAGSVVTVTFPVRTGSETFGKYTGQLRGNTVVDVSPTDQSDGYPIYRREHLRADCAPMATKTRCVTDQVLEVW